MLDPFCAPEMSMNVMMISMGLERSPSKIGKVLINSQLMSPFSFVVIPRMMFLCGTPVSSEMEEGYSLHGQRGSLSSGHDAPGRTQIRQVQHFFFGQRKNVRGFQVGINDVLGGIQNHDSGFHKIQHFFVGRLV